MSAGGPAGRGEDDLPESGLGEGFDFDAEFAKAFGPAPPLRSVLVVPVADAAALAQACTLAGVAAHVVPVRGLGCVLVTHDPTTGERDAQALSALLRGAELVLLTAGEESIEGQSWREGARGEDPKPGLLLSVWPDEVQELVLGRVDPAEAAGAAQGGEGSRIGAFWKLFRSRGGAGEQRGRDAGGDGGGEAGGGDGTGGDGSGGDDGPGRRG